jgi:hypothetical protein
VKVWERPDTFCHWASSRPLSEEWRARAPSSTPCSAKLKALHVPRIGVPNSFPDMRLRASESRYLPDIDTIVLQPCDVKGRSGRTRMPRPVAFGLVKSARKNRGGIT